MIAILPSTGSSNGREFSAFLWSPDGPGTTSGSLWINASGKSYHVPFAGRGVLSSKISGPVDAITFRLPEDAQLQSAFVDDLAGGDAPASAPCTIYNPWMPSFNTALDPERMARLKASKRTAPPIEAAPIDDPDSTCKLPNLPATTVYNPPVQTPRGMVPPKGGLIVRVVIRLNADSSIRDASTVPPASSFDEAALATAKQAVYQTQIVRCRAMPGTYIYAIEYNRY